MDGINILTQEVIKKLPSGILFVGIAVFFMLLMAFSGVFLVSRQGKVAQSVFFVWIAECLLYVAAMWLVSTVFAVPTGRYRYTAELSENVSLVEFYEKYTNIECKDGIWFFEDKEKVE